MTAQPDFAQCQHALEEALAALPQAASRNQASSVRLQYLKLIQHLIEAQGKTERLAQKYQRPEEP